MDFHVVESSTSKLMISCVDSQNDYAIFPLMSWFGKDVHKSRCSKLRTTKISPINLPNVNPRNLGSQSVILCKSRRLTS
jgi:hypothetical protein